MDLNKELISKYVKETLAEDRVACDVTTSSFIPAHALIEARIIFKEEGVLCGGSLAREAFRQFDRKTSFEARKKDGALLKRNETVALIRGKAKSILSCERVALNFLAHLSGIATQTRKVAEKVKKAGIRILDTRKTLPLLRALQKYAVVTGGGKNHRFDLSEQYLVKDNHLFVLKEMGLVERLASRNGKMVFEVEVESLCQLEKILELRPDIVMLDNFSPLQVRKAVRLIRRRFSSKKSGKKPFIEVSGGVQTGNISRYAIRGVDFISLGFLTHSAKSLDVSLEIIRCL